MKQKRSVRRVFWGILAAVSFIGLALAAHSADLNGDGRIDEADLVILRSQWSGTGVADLNHDGRVTVADAGILLSHWGTLPPPGTRFNVRDFGARGDGATDDTEAIQRTVDAAPNGRDARIYFPAGTYLVSSQTPFGFQVIRRSGLTFEGEGDSSIIRRAPTYPNNRLATIGESGDIVIRNMSFDASNIEVFGGVALYDMRRVRIENTRFFDSQPRGNTDGDHLSYVFGKGNTPSEDIEILNNRIDDLQLEVDHSRRVRIEGNVSRNSPSTGGIGVWAVGSDSIIEDYLITRNTVIDSFWAAIPVLIDHSDYRNASFRRIRIIDNRIVFSRRAQPAFPIGAGDASVPQTGHVFEDITLEGNTMEYEASAPPLNEFVISFQSAEPAGFNFQRVTVRNNRIIGNGRDQNAGFVMDLRRLQNSLVEGNLARGVTNGIAVIDNILNTRVQENTVGATDTAYHFGYSNPAGGNYFVRNRYFGNPRTPLSPADLAPSDVVEQPTQVPPPP